MKKVYEEVNIEVVELDEKDIFSTCNDIDEKGEFAEEKKECKAL